MCVFMIDKQPYLLALHRCLNLTHRRYSILKAFFRDDWRYIWEQATPKDLMEAQLDTKAIEKYQLLRTKISPTQEQDRLKACGAEALLYGTEDYPQSLANIYNPPTLLFVRGDITLLKEGLAIVGSRKITSYGKRILQQIIPPLIPYNIPIVSGFALGTDIEAHRITVQEGGKTIGVLGNGIDQVYPRGHRLFADKILQEEKGLFVSEYLPGVDPRPEHFPVRNRIISGLSRAVLIVEAAEKSGTLITAQLGLEQGKEVLAIPGDIFSPQSKGTNKLIASGQASCIRSANDIIDLLDLDRFAKRQAVQAYEPENEIETQILSLLKDHGQLHINDMLRDGNYEHVLFVSTLTLLEMKGIVHHFGSQKYGLGEG